MQLTHSKGNIVEKIVRDTQGRLVRATFRVYENNGRIKAHLLKVVYVEETSTVENKTLFLEGLKSERTFELIDSLGHTISPYFNLDSLYVSGSKPRAPTL